ncbi:MAG: hypothetical protein AAB390_02030 [Patescibacteria group bacterium]
MSRNIDEIEIIEPPMEELSKKHSCFRRTCLSCCGFIFVIIAASLVILKFTAGPRVSELKKLPDNFGRIVPTYDKENIETITLTSGAGRGQAVEIIAYLPKLIIAPLLLKFDTQNYLINKYRPDTGEQLRKTEKFSDKLILILKSPVGDHRDAFKIEWRGLSADAEFIEKYYKAELARKQFTIETTNEIGNISQFRFRKDDIDGVIHIEDDPKTRNTDFVVLSVNVRLENKSEL